MNIVPIRDLKNTTKIEKLCSETMEPVYITKNGYGKLVIMDIHCYEEFLELFELQKSIKSAEECKLYDMDTVLKELRAKYVK